MYSMPVYYCLWTLHIKIPQSSIWYARLMGPLIMQNDWIFYMDITISCIKHHIYTIFDFRKFSLILIKKRHGYTNDYIYPFFILNLLYKLIEQIKNAVSPVLFLTFGSIRFLTILSYNFKSSMEFCRVGKWDKKCFLFNLK